MTRCAFLPSSVARWRSGFKISTSASGCRSPAVTSFLFLTSSRSSFGLSLCSLNVSSLRFRISCVTSSTTPGTVENSCRTLSILTDVTAAPGIAASSTRRRALPRVTPKPRSSGSTTNLPYVSESSAYSTLGLFMSHTPVNPLFPLEPPSTSLPPGRPVPKDTPEIPGMARIDVAVWSSDIRGYLLSSRLSRVVFDDQLLVHRHVDVVARRQRQHPAGQRVRLIFEPARRTPARRLSGEGRKVRQGAAPLVHPHALPRLHEERRHRDPPAVHRDVPVRHELPRRLAARRQAEPVHDVVEPGLQNLQQARAGDARGVRRHLEVVLELRLVDAVEAAQPLLLAQPDREIGGLAPARRVHTGRGRVLGYRTLVRVALLALEIEPHAFPPAQPADGPVVPSHT